MESKSRLKVYFFILFLGYGCLNPYLSLFYTTSLNLTAAHVGILSAVLPIMTFLLTPPWTMLADGKGWHRSILSVNVLLAAGIPMALCLLDRVEGGSDLLNPRFLLTFAIITLYAAALAPQCSILDTVVLRALDHYRSNYGGPAKLPSPKELYGRQRWCGSVGYGLAGFVMAYLIRNDGKDMSLLFYANAITLLLFLVCLNWPTSAPTPKKLQPALKERDESKAIMKSISIANGLDVHASPVVVVDQKSMDNVTLLAAPEEGATQNAVVVVEEFLESEEFINDRKKKDDSVSSVSMYETFKTLIRHPSKTGNLPLFWLFCLIQGSALSIINNFWFITLVSSLHANQTILSVTNIARIALEVPFFIWCDAVGSVVVRGVKWAVKIVKIGDYRPIENGVNGADLSSEDMEIIGMRWMMVVSMGLLAFRLLMFSVMLMFSWNAWVNVAVELLHGIIYATFYSAAVQIASLSAPENLRTTSQGLFSAIFSGFGACLGSFVGGLIYGALGPIFLFGATLITTIVGIIIYSVDILRSSSRMKKSRPNTEDEAPVAVVVSPLRQRRSLPDISK